MYRGFLKKHPKKNDIMPEDKKTFGQQLVGGLTDGLTSGVGGLIGGAISGIGSMLGIGAKRQLRQQKELNEQAAMLNYEYGEKAAENQFRRQMEMYERSYKDQSYAAMRKQMEEAGLNVGLMFGGGGASGGGAGATSGVPMPETGGAVAGNAASQSEMMTAGTQAAMLGLQMQKQQAEIDVLRSEAERNRADAGNQNEEAETERRIRKYTVEKLRQEGIGKFIENFMNTARLEYDKDGNPKVIFYNEKNETLGFEIGIGKGSVINEEDSVKILKAYAEANEAEGNADAAEALAALQRQRYIIEWQELLNETAMVRVAQKNADSMAEIAAAKRVEARARRLAARWQTGEYMNWKTWTDLAFRCWDAAIDAANVIGMAKNLRRIATGKPAPGAPKTKGRETILLGPNGQPVAWSEWEF